MQPGKKGLVGGICIAVGVVIIAVAFGIAFPVLNSMKEAGIRSQLVVPAEGTEEWDAYASSETQADDLPFRQHFYFFNLTNPFEFYAGTENAIFDEVGPYVYRSWTKVFDAERTENTVKKYSYTWFTFEDDLSEGDPMTDRVIAINPTFLGALGEFGGEAGLLGMATSMALTQFVAGLSDPAAITEGYVGATGAALGGYRTATTLGGGLTTDGFIQNWRMTLMNTIPNATAYDLWDDGPTSLTNPNPLTNMFGGLILAQRTGAPTNASEALIMGAHAGIDATGMAALAAWIGPAVVGTVQAGAGVTSDAELVYAQWYNNGFFGMPLTLIDPAVYLFPIGYGAYLDTVGNTTSLNLTQATNVLNMFSNPVNFAGPAAVGDFMFRAATGDVVAIQAIYGIPPGEVPLMVDYLLHIQGTYGLFGLQAMTTLDAGAGLFADKTPHEWLFEYIDPLVMQNVALFENQTSEADVEGDIPDEIWTGDDDLSKAGYIYKVNDSTTYNDYGPTLEVSGSTGASFGPNPDTSSDLELWLGLFKRSIPLTHVGSRTLYDVELQTWEVAPAAFGSPDEFDSADDYNNPGTGWWLIDWFVPSVNLRVSLPYFEGVPEDDRPANLSGIPEPDPDNPKVGFFDIEPETGGAFATNMPLQICFEIGPLLSPTLYPNIPDTCAPFLWLETPLEISEDLANQFKDALGAVGTIRIVILSAGGVIGLIFVVAGVVMFMKSRARSNKVGVRKYGDLDDKDDGEGR